MIRAADSEQFGSRTKVLYVITSTAGGVGLNAYDIARFHDRNVIDLSMAYAPGYPMDKNIEALDLPVHHIPFSRKLDPITNVRATCHLYKLVRDGSYDVILSATAIAGAAARFVAKLRGVPCIFSTQLFASQPPLLSWPRKTAYRLAEQLLDGLTTHYVAVSETSKQFGIEHNILADRDCTVIHNSITTSEYVPRPCDPEFRKSLGLRADSRVVGTALRFEPQKGVSYLLDVIARIYKDYPDVEFVIGGDGPLKEQLLKQANDLGVMDVCRFIGWRTDLTQVLPCFNIFCHPTLWEQFPYMLLEALAMETPVVATAVDGVPEVVIDGETGILVPPKDTAALERAIRTMLDDLPRARDMARRGRELVLDRFDSNKMVKQYEVLFSKFSGKSNGREMVKGHG